MNNKILYLIHIVLLVAVFGGFLYLNWKITRLDEIALQNKRLIANANTATVEGKITDNTAASQQANRQIHIVNGIVKNVTGDKILFTASYAGKTFDFTALVDAQTKITQKKIAATDETGGAPENFKITDTDAKISDIKPGDMITATSQQDIVKTTEFIAETISFRAIATSADTEAQ
jgi:hypothetical protein